MGKYLNGDSASAAIKGAMALLLVMIVCITLIVSQGKEVPPEFTAFMVTISGALVGFLAGTRVVPKDVSAAIKSKAVTTERKTVADDLAEEIENAKG